MDRQPARSSPGVISFHILHVRLWETVRPEGNSSPPRCFSPSFFSLACGSPAVGHQTSNLQNSQLCLPSPAFSKYSHSSHASSFLIFSILCFVYPQKLLCSCPHGSGKTRRPALFPWAAWGLPRAPFSTLHLWGHFLRTELTARSLWPKPLTQRSQGKQVLCGSGSWWVQAPVTLGRFLNPWLSVL